MTDEVKEDVDQITKIPVTPLKKAKGPGRVAAGKKLAEYNRRVKGKKKN